MKQFSKFVWINFLGCLSLVLVSPQLIAGQTIYQYKESSGSTLLTNKKSSNSNLKFTKKTYYPESNMHTYSNWGKSEASVLPSYSQNRHSFDHYIRQAAQTHGISEGLIKAVMHTESGFNTRARSPVGAQGLMQLMPATAKRFNVSNAYDPQQNIFAGAKYLAWLLKRFNGNTQLALAGYNAGEGNVAKYGGIPPFRETQDYVRRVTSRFNNLYANGVGHMGTSNTTQTQGLAQSINYTPNNQSSNSNSNSNSNHTNVDNSSRNNNSIQRNSQRSIIKLGDGSYTDTPTGSYATQNAIASAKITFSN